MFGFRDGKEAVFESAVRAYSTDLFRFAYWLCRDRSLAEDLVQETFARAWRYWENLDEPQAVKQWLFTILRREHARLYERKAFRQIGIDDEEELELLAGHSLQPPIEVREALLKLPESSRLPLLMQVLGGFSAGEIAAALELTEGAVLARVSRARRSLRELLDPQVRSKEDTA